MKLVASMVASVCGVALAAVVLSPPAIADGLGTPAGYTATAQVRFSGDGAPGGGSSVQTIGVQAKCWFERSPGAGFGGGTYNPDDAASVAAAVKNLSPNGEQRTELPSQAAIDEAVRAQKDGKTRTLLWLTCVDFADTQAAWNEPGRQIYAFSGDGLPAPPPEVDPQDLAIRAQEIMVIPEPVVERNPKIDAQGSGTLVGLPTWFWVTNPESVGGPDGTKTIRAEVIGTPVFAEVVAHTNGLTLSSPAGGTSCPPGVAATAYTAGASDTSGCHVEFARASVAYAAGYPVTAATTWSATWTGRTQAGANVGGALNGLARATTVDVPVAETQALVHGMR